MSHFEKFWRYRFLDGHQDPRLIPLHLPGVLKLSNRNGNIIENTNFASVFEGVMRPPDRAPETPL